MDSIDHIRQMMAEQKFFEAQKKIEVQLKLNSDHRYELLTLLFECFQQQQKVFPPLLLIELAEEEFRAGHTVEALKFIEGDTDESLYFRTMKIKLKAAVLMGKMEELYHLLSAYYVHQFERQIPWIPTWVDDIRESYFKQDFHLLLKKLSLILLTDDTAEAEKIVRHLVLSSFEKATHKGLTEKLSLISEVLKIGARKDQLEVYQSLAAIYCSGIQGKADLKKLVEMVIYFDDFKFQSMILNLLHRHNLLEEAKSYASSLKAHPEFDFVYFEKYFPDLKTYFVTKAGQKQAAMVTESYPDIELSEKPLMTESFPVVAPDISSDELHFLQMLKYQSYSKGELCDLAVCFLQSEMLRAALKASELAITSSESDQDYLKACYLKLTCQLKLNDLRAAIDTCFDGLNKASSKDDVLSFMYGQADAFIRLGLKQDAKIVLMKIMKIDSGYRMTKERLDKLNEI